MAVRLRVEKGPHAGISRAEVLRRVGAMMELLQLENEEVSIVLTDDDQIQKLNGTYRGEDRPTDVLAFAMREGEFGGLRGGLLGDVIVSIPSARRQADARGCDVRDELTMLLAHGLLHLLGWDHETPAEDRRMRVETERLCRAAELGSQPIPTGRRARAPRRGRAAFIQSKQTRRSQT